MEVPHGSHWPHSVGQMPAGNLTGEEIASRERVVAARPRHQSMALASKNVSVDSMAGEVKPA